MSTKASNQPGRRTPLSLSGTVTKSGGPTQNNRGGSSTNNSNGHTSNHKVDNKNKTEQQQTHSQKQQPSADPKENSTKLQKHTSSNADTKNQKHQTSDQPKSHKQTNPNEKKQHTEKSQQQQQQNGVFNNHKTAGTQQQQINKEKQPSADTVAKQTEKDNKKTETTQDKHKLEEKDKNKTDDVEKNKVQEKEDKDEKKQKNDKNKQESEKVEDAKKISNIDIEPKKVESSEVKTAVKNAGADNNAKDKTNFKKGDDTGKMDVVEDTVAVSHQDQEQQKTSMSAPPTPKSVKDSKQSTPNKSTPTKTEKTPQKSTPTKREVTTCIDDFEMEPLNVESSPSKPERQEATTTSAAPCATSTPGKILLQKPSAKTNVPQVTHSSISPEQPRTFSQISGRRAIRPINDYTPSKFQSNLQFRESYRRINTELDVTNTSLNVTVGSEIPNNSSFSFFGRGRKRDRTPPQHSQSTMGQLLTNEMEMSPPKKARMDFFGVVSSPLTLLRNRFSKASLQSSTPVKLQQKVEENEDEIEVQNVSGMSVHEEIEKSDPKVAIDGDEDTSLGVEISISDKTPIEGELEILDNGDKELAMKSADKHTYEYADIKITETPLQATTGNTTAKNKRCVVM